jgi:FtsZ-binding cell division protein ZapB
MVNNSTNINKTKERLNSDGQQFHQYQQNRENLNSDDQQFHQYQQNKRKFKQ